MDIIAFVTVVQLTSFTIIRPRKFNCLCVYFFEK